MQIFSVMNGSRKSRCLIVKFSLIIFDKTFSIRAKWFFFNLYEFYFNTTCSYWIGLCQSGERGGLRVYVVVWKIDLKPCITSLENSCNRWSFILAKRLNYTIDESMKNTFLCWNWNCFPPGDIEVLQNWENEKESLYSILVKYGVYLERKQTHW